MRPTLTVIAGPNGSGKTTLTKYLQNFDLDLGVYINPDDIALGILADRPELADSPEGREQLALQARRVSDVLRAKAIAQNKTLTFETVMSHPSKLEFIEKARRAGYKIVLLFVGLDDPAVNVERVALRVAQGGHDVPEDRIRKRYDGCMDLLPKAAALADEFALFDNTRIDEEGGLRMVYHETAKARVRYDPIPQWAQKAFPKALS